MCLDGKSFTGTTTPRAPPECRTRRKSMLLFERLWPVSQPFDVCSSESIVRPPMMRTQMCGESLSAGASLLKTATVPSRMRDGLMQQYRLSTRQKDKSFDVLLTFLLVTIVAIMEPVEEEVVVGMV